jgi:hypothetical protein
MRDHAGTREPGQVVAIVVASLFMLAGVLDVGPGMLDNLVHLGFGLVGLMMSRNARAARAYLIGGSVAYFLLWQFGTVIDPQLVPFHTTNVGVHLALVASMIGLAVLSGRSAEHDAPTRVATEYIWDAHVESARPRPSRNRPPGRGDHRTSPRMAAAGRPPTILACRV